MPKTSTLKRIHAPRHRIILELSTALVGGQKQPAKTILTTRVEKENLPGEPLHNNAKIAIKLFNWRITMGIID